MHYFDKTSTLPYRITEQGREWVRVKQLINGETYWFTRVEFSQYFEPSNLH